MSTTQVKLTIPVTLKEIIEVKAARFGLSISAYIKHVLINDANEPQTLTDKAAKGVNLQIKDVLREYESGEIKFTDSVDEIDNL